MIAALYVQKGGCYYGLPSVDPWPEDRDARLYAGPHPVIAHPPCARWCQLAALVESLHPARKAGQDGGCFESALASVRRWGGVLEHPAFTRAWAAHGLSVPPVGKWEKTLCGGWVAHVDQFHYGHRARKSTWLYAHGVSLPSMLRGHVNSNKVVERMGKRERNSTPPAFRDMLISIAESAIQPARG